ncbi:MAG: hypothetical protein LBF22_04960 [Deltaproteobacteria bacterium]|nr:hypothetical protein [Deltaproteobacteria bacterium]
MSALQLKEFAKRASMAYSLSTSLKREKKGLDISRNSANRQILENTLLEATLISNTLPSDSESSAVDYAAAVTELARAYALHHEVDIVEQLFHKLPKNPKCMELDYIISQMAYLLADLSIKKGLIDKAGFIYRDYFPLKSSLGSELIRLDLAVLLVESYLEKDLLSRAKDLFFSYFQNDEIQFFCPVPNTQEKYAREEFSRILAKIAKSLFEYAQKDNNHDTIVEIEQQLEKCSETSIILELRLNNFRSLEKKIIGKGN